MSPTGDRRNEERGSISVFVVMLAPAFLALFGLIVDGGLLLGAQQDAIAVAEAAARRGAQDINEGTYRETGQVFIDASLAEASARQYFTAAGYTGDVLVGGNVVEVSIHRTQELPRLALVGLSSRVIKGTATARLRGKEDTPS